MSEKIISDLDDDMLTAASDERNLEILEQARKRMYESISGWEWIHERQKDDLEFSSGNQWDVAAQSVRSNRPCLVIDKTKKYVDKLAGVYRQQPPGVVVQPVATADTVISDIYTDYMRRAMTDTRSRGAIDTAGEHQAICGYGWIKVSYDFVSQLSDELEPFLVRVEDPRQVRIDRSSHEGDGSDMQWGMHLTRTSRSEAEYLYGDDVTSFAEVPSQYIDNWLDGNDILICDYYWIEEEDDVVIKYRTLDGKTHFQFESDFVKPKQHYVEIQRRNSTRKICYHAVLTGAGVIDWEVFPGSMIPIVPVYGRQAWFEDKQYYTGLIRPMMDSQRLINYYASTAAEVTALTPKAPWMVADGQIDGYEQDYELSMIKNVAILRYQSHDDKGNQLSAPSRAMQPTDVSPLLQAIQSSTSDMADTVGIYEASLGQNSNQKSGVAIREASENSDQVVAIFKDNLSRGVVRAAQIMINMLPYLITEESYLRVKTEEGDDFDVPVNTETAQPTNWKGAKDGKIQVDLLDGEFRVVLQSGTTYATRREEEAKASIEMMANIPPAMQAAVAPGVIQAQDWPGAQRMANAMIATLPPNIQQFYMEDEIKSGEGLSPRAHALLTQATNQIQSLHQESDQYTQMIQKLQQEVQQLKADQSMKQAEIQSKQQIASMEIASKEKLAAEDNKLDLQKAHIDATSRLQDTSLKSLNSEHIAHDRNDTDLIIATIDTKNQLGHPHL